MSFDEVSVNLYETIQELQAKYYEKIRHPFVAGLELTPKCNLSCVHCYMSDYPNEVTLSAEQWKHIIDKLHDSGVLILYMTGGEILTRRDFAEIYTHAKKRGFIIELLTNITCLTDEIVEVFKKYPPATVSISVYGMCEETYSAVTRRPGMFAKFKNNVQKLVDADIDIELKFIGLRKNRQDFLEAEKWANEIGAKFKFNFEIFPTLEGSDSVLNEALTNEEILEIDKNYPKAARVYALNCNKPNPFIDSKRVPVFTCNVASSLCYIDSLGYVSPCNKMRLKEHNILNEDLGDIWKRCIEEYANMLAPEDYVCGKCPAIHICAPCPVVNKLSTGKYVTPCPKSCELSKMRKAEFTKKVYDKYREEKEASLKKD
ncbi:MAG: radical SAM protein [Bacilli bacterium]|nr:radical SAM protein [Bacilli bacterium]